MPSTQTHPQHDQLIRDGFCLFPSIVDEPMIDQLARITERVIGQTDNAHFSEHRSTGSLIDTDAAPELIDLITLPAALEALRQMGFSNPKYQSGYIISKPAHSPPLFWHQDWPYWDEPCSYIATPHQIFFMYYLVDTDRHNGCLRVIPGSHRRKHRLVDEASAVPQSDELRRYEDPNAPEFQIQDDEIDVPVKAGDLIVGDARLLHAAHANQTDQRRTLIVFWYHPMYAGLPDSIKAYLKRRFANHYTSWPAEALRRLESLCMDYDGDAEPAQKVRAPRKELW